jgi:hypothetical protein
MNLTRPFKPGMINEVFASHERRLKLARFNRRYATRTDNEGDPGVETRG